MWTDTFHVVSFNYIVNACLRIFTGTFEAIWTDGHGDFFRMLVTVILFLVAVSLFRYLTKKWR